MKRKKIIACLAALIFLTSLTVQKPGTVSAAESAEIGKYRDRIAQLEKEQKQLTDKINSLDKEAAATLENKKYLDSLVGSMILKINATEDLISELDGEMAKTKQAISDSEEQIAAMSERMKERARQTHENGAAGYLDVLLGSTGVGDFLSRLERLNTMLEYDKTTMDNYKAEKLKLEKEKSALDTSRALQQNTMEKLQSDKAEFERKSADAAAYFDSLNADKAASKESRDKAAAAKDALDREIEELMRAAAARPTSASAPVVPAGDFMWPLPVGQGYISCNYGDTDPWNKMHWATDIAIAAGTPIYASADAAVVRATWHNSYGNYILLDHGGGNSTLYAHCSALAVSGGQSVKKGQVIGYVGTTGDSKGNHLHFEFRVNGKRSNPLSFVPKGC